MKNLLLLLFICAIAVTSVRGQADHTFSDRLEAERIEQSGTVITLVFDDSGSMAGGKLAQAKAAFRGWIETVPSNYRLSLLALNAGLLVPPGRDNRAELLRAVEGITAHGGTPLVDTIGNAIAQIEKRRSEVGPYERHILVVFTDGQESSQAGNDGVKRQLDLARSRRVETVGIGFHGQGDYMSGHATRYYDASDATELKNSLAKVDAEIGDTSDIVIDEATLRAMKTAAVVAPQAAVTPAPQPAMGPASAPPRPSGIRIPWVVIVIGVIIVLQLIGRATKKR